MRVFIILIILFMTSMSGAVADEIIVKVRGFASEDGAADIAIFESSATFLQTGQEMPNRCEKKRVEIVKSLAIFRCALEPGEYAILVYHDVNGNHELDVTAVRAPLEPVAFSNDAPISYDGPPLFEEAAFTVGVDTLELELNLQTY